MNKEQLVNKVAAKVGMAKSDASAILNCILDVVKDALVDGEKVTIVGSGTIQVVDRAARNGINPTTMSPIKIPAKKAIKFTAGKALKEAINK